MAAYVAEMPTCDTGKKKRLSGPPPSPGVLRLSDLYSDIIMTGMTPSEHPFVASVISPYYPDDRRVFGVPEITQPRVEEYERLAEEKDPDGRPIYNNSNNGMPSVKMKKVVESLIRDGKTNVFVGNGNGIGPHRYMAYDGNIFAANFDIEIEDGRLKMLGSDGDHPLIALELIPSTDGQIPEARAQFYLSQNGREYRTQTQPMDGRAVGLGSYRSADDGVTPYRPVEPVVTNKHGYSNLPLFAIDINGDSAEAVADSIFRHIGHRVSSVAIALYSPDGWQFNVINESSLQPVQH